MPYEPTDTPDIFHHSQPNRLWTCLRDCPADPIEVTITNRGLETLDISSITLQGDGDTAFTHNGQATSLEFDESTTFTIDFTPTLLLDLDLIVESNDPDEPQAMVDVLGQGASGALYEESFQQTYDPVLDVLWVVDNSESMSNAIDNVRTNFESFIGEFLALNLDYHMAAVTTDMVNPDQSGKFQGQMIDHQCQSHKQSHFF